MMDLLQEVALAAQRKKLADYERERQRINELETDKERRAARLELMAKINGRSIEEQKRRAGDKSRIEVRDGIDFNPDWYGED